MLSLTNAVIGTALLRKFATSGDAIVSVDAVEVQRPLLENETFHQVDLSDVSAIERLWKDLAAAGT